jgi:2-polyprenyl-6-methoxyphenol hydroxylase-like FAD-dependent oxidoreductase
VAAFASDAAVPASLAALGCRPRIVFGNGVRAGLVPLGRSRFYWFTTQNEPADAPRVADPEACRAAAAAAVAAWDPATTGAAIRAAIAGSAPDTLTKSRIVDRLGWPWAPSGGWAPAAGGGGGGGRSPGPITLVGDAAHPTTPNLAQGGGLGLEDAVVLARCLAGAGVGGGKKPSAAADAAALRAFEAQRASRAFAVTLKSRLVGIIGQVPGPAPLLAARDWALGQAVTRTGGNSLLGHTAFDAGALPRVAAAGAGRGKVGDGGAAAVPGK